MMRDSEFPRAILCTVAVAMPVHEAATVQDDLRRADIEPFAWVIMELRDPVVVARTGFQLASHS